MSNLLTLCLDGMCVLLAILSFIITMKIRAKVNGPGIFSLIFAFAWAAILRSVIFITDIINNEDLSSIIPAMMIFFWFLIAIALYLFNRDIDVILKGKTKL